MKNKLPNLNKSDTPQSYAKLANSGLMLGYPVKIAGETHRKDNGVPFHSSIKVFNADKDHVHAIHHIAQHLPLNPPDAKNTQIEPSEFKDRNGNTVYVLKLHGNSAEKLKEHHGKFSHMGDPENYEFQAHISVPKDLHDKIKSANHKTAHEAGIEFGRAELKRGPKVIKVYHHEPDTTEPKIPDLSDFTAKIGKSEDLIDMNKSEDLSTDDDSHALLNRQEDKYFLSRNRLEEVITTLSERLALGDIDTDTRYNTNRTIYLDNQDLTIFHDCITKKKPRMKVRIRQYSPNSKGWEEVAYAEFKMKEEDGFTKKIRVRIPAIAIETLSNGGQIILEESLVNINKDIDRKLLEARVQAINSSISRQGLKKQLEVRYERRAYTGKNIRITIDENLRYMDCREIDKDIKKGLEEDPDWKEFSEPYIIAAWENPVIMEVKSDKETPHWMKTLLKETDAKDASFSKYSAALITFFRTGQKEGNVLSMLDDMEMNKSEDTLSAKPLMKPYSSEAQRRWAHTASGEEALGGPSHVHEWDEATKGKKLPEHVKKSEDKDVDITVVVLRDGNFVLVGKRRRNKKWGLPGGRNEGKGETNEQCALRELKEETGIELKPEDLTLEGVRKTKAGGENKHVYVYTAQFPGGEPTIENDPDEEFTKWRWMRCEDGKLPEEVLDDEMTPPAEAAFDELDMTKNDEQKYHIHHKGQKITEIPLTIREIKDKTGKFPKDLEKNPEIKVIPHHLTAKSETLLEKGFKEAATAGMMGLASLAPHPAKADYRHVNAYIDSMKNIPGLKVRTQLTPGMSHGKISVGKFNINTKAMLGGKSPISNHQINISGPNQKTWTPQDSGDYDKAKYIYNHLQEKMPTLMEMTGPIKKSEFVEMLEKGAFKNAGVALGMAGALAGASIPKANPKALETTPQSTQGPQDPVFNPQKMLQAIAQVESSGGKNENHQPLQNGEVAYGKYALLPTTIKDTIKGHKDLASKYGKALALQGPQFHNYMRDNKGLEDTIAQRHLAHMQHVLGSDPNAISMGWLDGINGALKAQKSGKDIPNHWYVKRVMNNYNK